jgi:hypothetical protein
MEVGMNDKKVHWVGVSVLMLLVSACGPTTTQANPTLLPVKTDAGKNIRDTRYCEVIPVYREWFSLKAEVFNTLGLNDCPQDLWAKITTDAMKTQTGAVSVALNGPRAWAMDEIVGRGATAEGKQVTFGGIPMIQRATLSLSANQVSSGKTPVYQEQTVDRDSVYVYLADKPIRKLISPEGKVYVMQTYDLKISPSSLELSKLGQRLSLPTGWKYLEQNLTTDLTLTVDKQATVTRDNLENTYQYAPNLKP